MEQDALIKSRKRRKWKQNIEGWLISLGPFVGFLLFTAVPMIISLYISFTGVTDLYFEWDDLTDLSLDNYIRLFTDEETFGLVCKTFVNTLYFTVNIFISMALGLWIANLLSKDIVFKRLFRTIFFVPYVCSITAVALTWQMMYSNEGFFNVLLDLLGLPEQEWLYNSQLFMPAVILMTVWCRLGYVIILYQAALCNFNQTYIEAAKLDGASNMTIFWKIVFPLITPTTFYLLTMKLISSLQMMVESQVLASGTIYPNGPDNAGYTVVYYLYNMSIAYPEKYGFGISAALSWLFSLFILLITGINFKLADKWVHYDD